MSQYINGAFIPKQERLHAIAEALNVSEGWLMGYENRSCIEFFAPDDSMLGANIPKGFKILLKENDIFADWDSLINGNIIIHGIVNKVEIKV